MGLVIRILLLHRYIINKLREQFAVMILNDGGMEREIVNNEEAANLLSMKGVDIIYGSNDLFASCR